MFEICVQGIGVAKGGKGNTGSIRQWAFFPPAGKDVDALNWKGFMVVAVSRRCELGNATHTGFITGLALVCALSTRFCTRGAGRITFLVLDETLHAALARADLHKTG